MLTKSDLQAIQDIVSQNTSPLGNRLDRLEKKVDKMQGSNKWWFRKLQRTDNEILGSLDKAIVKTNIRVDKIERHLGLPTVN